MLFIFLLRSWSLGGRLCALFNSLISILPLLDFLSFLLLLLELLVEHFHDFFVIDAFVDFALFHVRVRLLLPIVAFQVLPCLLVHGLDLRLPKEQVGVTSGSGFLWRLFFA